MEKEDIKKWLKEPLNFVLILVLIFGIGIRLYYFSLTLGQPLWWDEAAYGSVARNFANNGIWDHTDLIIGEKSIRPPLFSILWGILIKIGFGESGVRFLLNFLPSVIAVFFVYLIGKEIYGKRAAIISTFIFSVLWIHLFYTGRLLTHIPDMGFLFPSIYFFILSMKKEFNGKYFSISLILGALSTLIRYPNGLIFFVYLGFLAITLRIDLLKNKKFWLSGVIGMTPLLIFFINNYFKFGNIFPAFLGSDYVKAVNEKFGFYVLNFIPAYLTPIFFGAFLIGILVVLFELVLGFDQISKDEKLKGNLLILLLFVAIYSFFIFYIRGAEDRWLFPASISLVLFSGYGLNKVYEFIKKYQKNFAVILILALLLFGAYKEITFADEIINNRKQTYLQIRQGFEWIKDNTPENSKILGAGIEAYSLYYAEREYISFAANEEDTEILAQKADYLVLHVFSNHPEFVNSYVQERQDIWKPVMAFFMDDAKTQPGFVIYQKV